MAQTATEMSLGPTVRHRDDRPRMAYQMSLVRDSAGAQVHSWPDIAATVGYNSKDAAQMAATRYERGLEAGGNAAEGQAPWDVPTAQRAEYPYRMWLLLRREESGARLTDAERGQLAIFKQEMGPLPGWPHGVAIYFDETTKVWTQRERRAGEGPFVDE